MCVYVFFLGNKCLTQIFPSLITSLTCTHSLLLKIPELFWPCYVII